MTAQAVTPLSHLSTGGQDVVSLARASGRPAYMYIETKPVGVLHYKTDVTIQSSLLDELSEATQLIVTHRLQTVMDADKMVVREPPPCIPLTYPAIAWNA